MPAADQRDFVAIPAPAPSIPVRFRLYHGGSPKRGWLVTGDPERCGYLGDVVCFSTHHDYARRYIGASGWGPHPSSLVRGQGLFVIDARSLPPGCRVLVGGATAADAVVENRLFDLADAIDFARDWLDTGESRRARVGWELHKLSCRVIRRRSEQSDDPSALSECSLRRLEAVLCRAHPPDPEDRPADRFSSMLLYLLEACGTLEPTPAQVRAAIAAYRRDWLDAFSVPLNPLALDTIRPSGAYPWPAATDGLIVLVPGPVPVLARRHTAGRRQRRNLPSGPMIERSTKSSPV